MVTLTRPLAGNFMDNSLILGFVKNSSCSITNYDVNVCIGAHFFATCDFLFCPWGNVGVFKMRAPLHVDTSFTGQMWSFVVRKPIHRLFCFFAPHPTAVIAPNAQKMRRHTQHYRENTDVTHWLSLCCLWLCCIMLYHSVIAPRRRARPWPWCSRRGRGWRGRHQLGEFPQVQTSQVGIEG